MTGAPYIDAMVYSEPLPWLAWVWLWASMGWAWPAWTRRRRLAAGAAYVAWLLGGWVG